MYIFNNALKNLRRNMGRNILIGLVLFAVIATTVVGLVINSTTSAIIDDYRTRFGSRVNITLDTEAFLAETENLTAGVALPGVTPGQAIAFAKSEYLFDYTMTASTFGGSHEIIAVGAPQTTPMFGDLFEGDEFISPTFNVLGDAWTEFETGERYLLAGQMPQADREALISHELAEINGLSVGAEITMYRSAVTIYGESMYVRNYSSTFIIVGIYFDMTETAGTPFGFGSTPPLHNRRNDILTTLDTLLNAMEAGDEGVSITAVFYLRNPSYLPYFEAEIRGKGLSDMMIVSTDEAAFNAIVEPVEGLRSISITFIIVVLALGAIILVLLSNIAIRERKYEIGVLRAMGMKKGKVARGLLYEMGALTVICLAIGLVAGTIASQPVADTLLQQQVEIVGNTAHDGIQQRGTANDGMAFFEFTPTASALLSEISVRLGFDVMLQIAGISLLLAFAASAMGIANITKYEPIKILMERN